MKVISTLLTLLIVLNQALASSAAANTKDDWLKAHNDMRFKYHTANSKTVVNLQWSTGLAALAKTWAEGITDQCKNRAGDDDGYGRNSVLRQDLSSGLTPEWALANWGKQYELGYPTNQAFTQAIWRSTEYVGCYISVNEAMKCKAAVCYYAQPGNCGMSGAAGTDADSVAVWTEKVFADPSQKNNCGNLCPPEGCREVPINTNVFQVSKPTRKPTRKATRKPTRSNAVTSNTVDGNKKLSCHWSQMYETAENHKQACMAANDEFTVPYTCNGELTKICCTVSGIVNPTFGNDKFGTCLKNGATKKPTSKPNLRKPTRKNKKI